MRSWPSFELRAAHRDHNSYGRSTTKHFGLTVRVCSTTWIDRLPDLRARAAVVARAIIDRGDALPAFAGPEILIRRSSLLALRWLDRTPKRHLLLNFCQNCLNRVIRQEADAREETGSTIVPMRSTSSTIPWRKSRHLQKLYRSVSIRRQHMVIHLLRCCRRHCFGIGEYSSHCHTMGCLSTKRRSFVCGWTKEWAACFTAGRLCRQQSNCCCCNVPKRATGSRCCRNCSERSPPGSTGPGGRCRCHFLLRGTIRRDTPHSTSSILARNSQQRRAYSC